MSRFRFIDAEKARFPVSLLCKIVGVSKSGYYAWKSRAPSKRSREDAVLTEKIREVYQRSRETYGYPRVHAELRALGVRCGRRRVARLMRRAGLRGCMRARKKRTTRCDPRAVPAPDLVKRDFHATAPDRLWTADITYLKTDEGFLYLAFVLDVYSRRIVGWSMATHLRTELVVDALEMAVWRRKPAAGLVHHSDRGVQYTALSFGKRLEEAGIVPSMGRAGSALDNAVSESFVYPQMRARPSAALSHPGGRQKCRLRVSRSFLQPEAAAFLARLPEPGELRRTRDEGGSCGVAKKCPPNRCNSRVRNARRSPKSCTRAQAPPAMPKSIREGTRILRRPNRSESAPSMAVSKMPGIE
jgi:putative transposase